MPEGRLAGWRARARALKQQALVAYYVARDPALPWRLRLLAQAVTAYVFSPIDLIPDFIPILGWLDELLVLSLGLGYVLRHAPPAVVERARARAAQATAQPTSVAAAGVILLLWALAAFGLWRLLR